MEKIYSAVMDSNIKYSLGMELNQNFSAGITLTQTGEDRTSISTYVNTYLWL